MAKIKQLSHHEAQKIAAGEVVERPANIVKELVENSIDAGATRISIYIEESGKKLIRIVDNGCGMESADALICFDRHATSKITRVDELESINTFGFRGEALASIAAVSQITLITKEEHSLEGTQVIIEANSITTTNSVACTTGTDISVHNLFFNVPARKKFLKAPQTEWRAIQLLFNAFCFDYPHIHFTLFSDGKQVHNCPVAQNIKNRALQLWESATHKHLLTITVDGDISLHGVVSDHQQYRYDRSSIYFFVNKRWVKNQHLGSALIKGYANVIPQGRYPIAAINITVPAHEVDINIHPRKEEIKFLHPRRVEQALQQAIKAALENNLSQHLKKEVALRPTSTYQEARDFNSFNFDSSKFEATFTQPMRTQTFVPVDNPLPFVPFDTFLQAKTLRANGEETTTNNENFSIDITYDNKASHLDYSSSARPEPVEGCPRALEDTLQQVQGERSENKTQCSLLSLSKHQGERLETNTNEMGTHVPLESYRLIGQYKTTYLLVEKEDGLFLVDQHAAHERILYELFSERFSDVATIHLLFPQVVVLSPHDIDLITPHLDIFSTNGILIEQYAQDQLIVQSLPVHLKEQSLSDLI